LTDQWLTDQWLTERWSVEPPHFRQTVIVA
jgi:hypothetical protein